MSITLYKAKSYGSLSGIDIVIATRITRAFYYTKGHRVTERRNAMAGENFMVFENEADAINWLRSDLKQMAINARKISENAARNLNEFNQKYPEL